MGHRRLAFDIIIRGGTVVTAADRGACDVAIRGGRIVALGSDLGDAHHVIDATGRLVMPGGVEGHCHIEQRSSVGGVMNADDFYTATRSAVFGGTTTVISFAAQQKSESLRPAVQDYHAVAAPKAVIDYGFHLIVADPTDQVLGQELPALVERALGVPVIDHSQAGAAQAIAAVLVGYSGPASD